MDMVMPYQHLNILEGSLYKGNVSHLAYLQYSACEWPCSFLPPKHPCSFLPQLTIYKKEEHFSAAYISTPAYSQTRPVSTYNH